MYLIQFLELLLERPALLLAQICLWILNASRLTWAPLAGKLLQVGLKGRHSLVWAPEMNGLRLDPENIHGGDRYHRFLLFPHGAGIIVFHMAVWIQRTVTLSRGWGLHGSKRREHLSLGGPVPPRGRRVKELQVVHCRGSFAVQSEVDVGAQLGIKIACVPLVRKAALIRFSELHKCSLLQLLDPFLRRRLDGDPDLRETLHTLLP